MISKLTGSILHKDTGNIILNVGGVGYKIFISENTLSKIKGAEVSLWTHLAVREDSLDLYGFLEKKELDFFEMLISVSGIGPKSGLAILSLASVENLQKSISSGDIVYLTKVSGIGRKTAEKILLELRDKIGSIDGGETEIKEDSDVLEALKSLGYSSQESRDALRKISVETMGASARVKEALKILSGGQ